MIGILFMNELRKTRRSLALVLMVAAPLVVVLFNIALMLKNGSRANGPIGAWEAYWLSNFALWCYFMLPMYIALSTSFLSGSEHRNHTWRLMFTLPVSPHQLFLAKALVAYALVLGACFMLYGLAAAGVLVISLFGRPAENAMAFPAGAYFARIALGCLPTLTIHHVLAWRFPNLVLPLAAGVFGTIGIMQVGSSEYWVYWPWSYSMMAANGSTAALQLQAMLLAVAVAASFYAMASLSVVRSNLHR